MDAAGRTNPSLWLWREGDEEKRRIRRRGVVVAFLSRPARSVGQARRAPTIF